MSNANAEQASGVGRVLTLSRTFDAPRDLVWAAWTEPARVAQWWGPAGWTNPVCELDLRPGGAIFIEMKGPEPWGSHPMGGTFVEVDPPQRLVFISRAFGNDADGWKLEVENTVTFTAQGEKTLMQLSAVVKTATPEVAGALAGQEMGWSQSLDKLEELLTGQAAKPGLELVTYLLFNGNCAEAFQFYAALLGGTIEALMPHRGTPAEGSVAEEWRDKIIHGRLRTGASLLMASDAPPDRSPGAMQGFNVSLQLTSPAEAERIWAGLAEGAEVYMPLGPTFFARSFGMLRDRFGTPWMVNCQ
jgi:PhnB protein